MGYLVVIVTLTLLVFFSFRNIRRFLATTDSKEVEGFCLLTDKYFSEENQLYYGVFQQGDKQIIGQLSASQYISLQVPQRGYLRMKGKQVLEFQVNL